MVKQVILRSSPELQGISSTALLGFIDAADQSIDEMHSLMLLRHGQVVAEGWWAPYSAGLSHTLFSLTKSFTSSAIGLAEAEGRLSLEDKLISFFPEETPGKIDENMAKMEVRHLLSMSSGHHEDSSRRMVEQSRGNWVHGFLSLPVEHEPGTYFVYDSGASYMLGAIIRKVTGVGLKEYLTPRLFEPLGIMNPRWERCPRGIEIGGWGLHVKTEDIARFGQLYLQKGVWNGVRILPEVWVEAATSKQVSNGSDPNNDWNQGYGYQFWRCRHQIYRGDGAFGQYCIVMPEQNAVLAITSGVKDMQAVLDLVWDKLLPLFGEVPLPESQAAFHALTQRLAGQKLMPSQSMFHNLNSGRLSGRKFEFEPNQMRLRSMAFDFTEDGCTISAQQGSKNEVITGGWGEWKQTVSSLFSNRRTKVAASCVWQSNDKLEVTLRHYETPFFFTMVFEFVGDQLRLNGCVNVSFGPTEFPQLVGKVA